MYILQVRRANFYQDGDTTPYGQIQPRVHITRCWDTLLEKSEYSKWRARVDNFNKYVIIRNSILTFITTSMIDCLYN